MSIEEILQSLNPKPSRRTLQRRLKEMVLGGQVTRIGKGRGTAYTLASRPSTREGITISASDDDYESFIPLDEVSREILSYVRQPLSARKPVAFSRDLIDDYRPGKTWYLSQATRRTLKQISETGFESRPAGTFGRAILDRLLIDLSFASSRLEGNTYTRLETKRLIEMGELVEGRDAQEAQMILNHKRAVELLVDDATHIGFNRYTFLNLHGALSENLMTDPSASGRLRERDVEIAQSVYQPTNVPQLIEDVFDTILQKAEMIADPFEQALFVLVQIPYLQPFEDVNKRVARLGANISLIKHNLCPLTFLDVPERAFVDAVLGVYEMNRVELLRDLFQWAYERSTQQYIKVKGSLAQPDPVRLKYREQMHDLIGTVVRELKTQVRRTVVDYAEANLPMSDRELFADMVMEDLKRLHEGVIARYRIRPSEYTAWKTHQKAQ
ncbi:MAG: Fic family protein [Deltaproteobacteria bacterium]|nr:Fic family protein [Deltaproteobacteria bacterium]